jgi:hypothetical protein
VIIRTIERRGAVVNVRSAMIERCRALMSRINATIK